MTKERSSSRSAAMTAGTAESSAEFPDLLADLEAERAKFPDATITHEQVALLLNNVAWKHRPEVGLFRKEGGNYTEQPRTGVRISVDWLVHRPSGKGADVLRDGPGLDNAGQRVPGEARPQRSAGEDVDLSRFVDAVDPLAPNTHRYIGGGNDTGICDDCSRPKAHPVHEVPEGKVPHEPWLGEDGRGECDLCMRPVSDPIHSQPGNLEARVVALENKTAELDARVVRLEQRLTSQISQLQKGTVNS
jgi:hypothetical protein